MKRFILIVTHGTGEIAMETDTPDLVKAIEIFNTKMCALYGDDKSSMRPHLLSAKIIPILYERGE